MRSFPLSQNTLVGRRISTSIAALPVKVSLAGSMVKSIECFIGTTLSGRRKSGGVSAKAALLSNAMIKTFLSMWVIAVPIFADSIPAGWIVLKDSKGVCQIGAPGNFKKDENFPGLGRGPGDTVEVQILSSPAPVKPIMESVAKMMHIEKLIDNTAARLFYREAPTKGPDGKQLTGWTVKVPRGTGNCFATITVSPGGNEDLVTKIAATIGPVR